jgi:hypothetical protein
VLFAELPAMKARIRNYRRLLVALVLDPVQATLVVPVSNCLWGVRRNLASDATNA